LFNKVFIIVFLLKLTQHQKHNPYFHILQPSKVFVVGMNRSQGKADRNEFTKRNYI